MNSGRNLGGREREMGSGRAPCCEKIGLKKGPWTPLEDMKLVNYIRKNGHGNWRALPKQAGLLRCGKSCRLRWINYLRPDIKRGNFTQEEEETIIKLHNLLGNKWSAIASRLPGRTDNEIKNVWNTHLKKRLKSELGDYNISSPNESKESPRSCDESKISYTNSEERADEELYHFQNQCDGNIEQIHFDEMFQILDDPPAELFEILDDGWSSFTTSLSTVSQDGWETKVNKCSEKPMADEMSYMDGNSIWYRYLERELDLCPEEQLHPGSVDIHDAGVKSESLASVSAENRCSRPTELEDDLDPRSRHDRAVRRLQSPDSKKFPLVLGDLEIFDISKSCFL